MMKHLLPALFFCCGAIAQQITNPNSGTWAGNPGQRAFSPFPLNGRPEWQPSPDGMADTQIIFNYLEPGILACAGEISGLNNSVFGLQEQMTSFQTSLDTLSGDIAVAAKNQRATGIGGGAVAVPGLDKVMAISGNAPLGEGKMKSLETINGAIFGGNVQINGKLTVLQEINSSGIAHFSGLLSDSKIIGQNGISAGGKVTGVSEPTADSDAATKGYVDFAVTNIVSDTVVVYTLVPSGSGLRLKPVRLSGVKSESTTGLESYEIQPKSVVVSASGNAGKLATQSQTILTIAPSSNQTESVIIEFVDHGSLGN